jgi:hypothetical protein
MGMERFCLAVDDDDMREELCEAIRGRDAFRRVKDRAHVSGLTEAWYRYRDAALQEIALAWCEEHGIPWHTFTPVVAGKRREATGLIRGEGPSRRSMAPAHAVASRGQGGTRRCTVFDGL